MNISLFVVLYSVSFIGIFSDAKKYRIDITTADRIANHSYPVEAHEVITSDGYILTAFRIPYSPREKSNITTSDGDIKKPRPVFLFSHGLGSSSDMYIISGPDKALAYVLADAGYDVWLGNHRGNVYSREHVKLSPEKSEFWRFSWHELGVLDMPALVDYILATTGQEKLHFIGHSQGTTVFFAFLSDRPEYSSKIKTAFMLAPTGFLKHVTSPLYTIPARILNALPFLSDFLESREFMPMIQPLANIGAFLCSQEWLQRLCAAVIFIIEGWDSENFDYEILPELYRSHPTGESTGQVIHYLQGVTSGRFRKYDHRREKNLQIYGQETPPDYNLSNIKAPVRFYNAKNDFFAVKKDIQKMERMLPNLVESYDVPLKMWNHIDFVLAVNAKEHVFEKIIKTANYYEETGKQL